VTRSCRKIFKHKDPNMMITGENITAKNKTTVTMLNIIQTKLHRDIFMLHLKPNETF